MLTARVDPVGDGGEPPISEGLQLNCAKVLDLELMLATPINQGGFGDVQLSNLAKGYPWERGSTNRWTVFSSCTYPFRKLSSNQSVTEYAGLFGQHAL